MDKSTLSNYGWIVIAVLVLAVMIALATPFGNYIKAGVESTTAGLFDTSEKAMNVVGMSAGDGSFDGDTGLSTPDHNGPTIPEGAYYGNFDAVAMEIIWYTKMPEFPSDYDVYLYGDYFYMYGTIISGWNVTLATESYAPGLYPAGFEVTTTNQTSYDVILESINGQPVTSMYSTFSGCTSLTTAPEIPSGVTDMSHTFSGCTNLTTAPAIPNSVTIIERTFYNCKNLTGTITINANPTEWTQCLYNTKITAVVGDTTMAASILNTKTSYATNPTA